MSEEKQERGLLGDIAIFVVVIGLGLAAIYMSGNWPWFLKMVANFETDVKDFVNMFTTNVKDVANIAQNAPQM